jgi:hypothetical protein
MSPREASATAVPGCAGQPSAPGGPLRPEELQDEAVTEVRGQPRRVPVEVSEGPNGGSIRYLATETIEAAYQPADLHFFARIWERIRLGFSHNYRQTFDLYHSGNKR